MTETGQPRSKAAKALRASALAGLWSLTFALVFYLAAFVLTLALAPLVDVLFLPQKLLGLPHEGALLPVAVFWSMLLYLGIFAPLASREQTPEEGAREWAPLGLAMAVAFIGGFAYLVQEQRTGAQAREARDLATEIVRQDAEVMRQAGGKGLVYVATSRTQRNGLGRYEVSVAGPQTIHAIVEVSEGAPKPRARLLCTTPVDFFRRAPGADPCVNSSAK